MSHIENKISDTKWNRDHERFAAGLMTEAEVKRCIAYWRRAARTCSEASRAIEFSDYAESMASVMQDAKDHALYEELGQKYGLKICEVRDLIQRYEEANNNGSCLVS